MKWISASVVLAAGCISIAWASPAAPTSPSVSASQPLTSIRDIRSLTNLEAEQALPVSFEATVTYFQGYRRCLFVQDGNQGIYIAGADGLNLVPGDRVLVLGNTTPGYLADVVMSTVTVLSHGPLPKPSPATFDQLIRGRFDSLLVTARGVVQSANLDAPLTGHAPGTTLRVLMDGGYVDAEVDSYDAQALSNLLDSEVEITGVAGGKFDGKRQLTGIVLHVASPANIRTLKPAAVSPWSLPLTPMDKVLSVYHVKNLTDRVRVSGTVTYFNPGSALVLQYGGKSIWIKTESLGPMPIGDRAEATGFPNVSDGFLMLYGSAIRDDGFPSPLSPAHATWQQLASSQHIFDLVSIDGQVVTEAREDSQDEYVLVSEGHMFSAVFPHGAAPVTSPPMRTVPIGSRIRVTGICTMVNANPYGHDVPFNILLRTADDLVVLAEPSWFTVRHLGTLVLLLLLTMLGFGARAWFVDRTMRAQVAALGYLGNRRGLILEDINNSRPLPGILERITELGSASLKGAPCWCRLADGLQLGNAPQQSDTTGLRIVEHAIAARSGPALGSIFAAFDARTAPHAEERRALAAAAELATLAIETARLYSDLVHRSEFDMLTDIKNRFAFEKNLDCLLEEARRTDGVFGLIYIDLDEFKQVNDVYGHHVGDLYIQQAAMRMKRQLRPEDILARLGGDEFAVLVPVIQHRADVEEIALRLDSCFDDPFAVDGFAVRGSASIGTALYPADATTRDGLLTTADSNMYSAKNNRKGGRRIPVERADLELTSESRL